MAEKNFTIKRKTSSGYDTFYPKTTVDQLEGVVTTISSSSTDSQVASAKCVYDIIGNVETLLSQI